MARGHYDIEDKVVLITGGARGIGGEAGRRLVERGARVALVDRDTEELERHAATLGGEVLPVSADVTDRDEIEAAVTETIDRFGHIDVVIANAGISGKPGTALSIDPAEFERVIEVNVLGMWRTVRAALPSVVERQGYVLPIASLAAAAPVPLAAAYATSKAGVEAFGRSLRMELARTGTRVGIGYFGFIDTDMVRNAFADPIVAQARKAMPRLISRPIPVGAAGAAIVRGIERRSNRVYAPRWVSPLLTLRAGIAIFDAVGARDPRFKKACDMAEETTPTLERVA